MCREIVYDKNREGIMRFCKMKVIGEVEKSSIFLSLFSLLYLFCQSVCFIFRLKVFGQGLLSFNF